MLRRMMRTMIDPEEDGDEMSTFQFERIIGDSQR
jgi:hypothetical protein